MSSNTDSPLTYKDAGVDIEAGDELVDRIRPLASSTSRAECLGGLGGFGGLFELPTDRYRHPVLVSGTDGVGTKLKLAIELNRHTTIGIDLVAMCVNDIIVCGAEPLFFLDYFATGRLDPRHGEAVVRGIAAGCREAGAALVGGETAEMPGMYRGGDYDLAGFAVGVVEKERIIDGRAIGHGDVLIGLASSGIHSNGYSLVRRILEVSGTRLDEPFEGETLGEALLRPTRIYVRPLSKLLESVNVHGIAHITGGGLPGNVVRMLGAGQRARIDAGSWTRPTLFDWLGRAGNVPESEMLKTFNCGIGMVLAVPADEVVAAMAVMEACRQPAWPIGVIESGERSVEIEP